MLGAYVLRVALRRSLLPYGLRLSVTTCSPLHSPDCFSGPIRSRCQASMTRLADGICTCVHGALENHTPSAGLLDSPLQFVR